jgi:hypothetical protein
VSVVKVKKGQRCGKGQKEAYESVFPRFLCVRMQIKYVNVSFSLIPEGLIKIEICSSR